MQKLWVLGVFFLVACSSANEGPCADGVCLCVDESDCDYVCADEPCDVTCQSVSNCSGTCGDACITSCTDVSNCDLGCGDGCGVECARVSNCRVDCGVDCAVSCSNASNCDVSMISGEVHCAGSVSDCDIRCLLPDGSEAPADACGDGVYACPAC